MKTTGVELGGVRATDGELRAALGEVFARIPGGGAVSRLSRAPFAGATSFAAETVEVRTDTGAELRLFVKDMSSSRLPRTGLEARRRRELGVYRDLLPGLECGTPRYYGAIENESQGRLCLLLEYVDGTPLESMGFDYWVLAAAWLGRFQGLCSSRGLRPEPEGVLVTQDARYFRSTAERGQAAVDERSTILGRRLARALRDYEERIAVMTAQPKTLVHGSFRPSNVLVDAASAPPRVCPVDWEFAAWGSPLYDLAFLADGCGPPDLDTYWKAYGEGAEAYGIQVPALGEVRPVLDSFYVHKLLKALSESVAREFPEHAVATFVDLAVQRCGAR